MTRTPVAVTLRARLDRAHHTARATLTVGADRFQLVQPAVRKGATTRVLSAFEAAMDANDWRGLYAIATRDITNAMTADAFVAQATLNARAFGTTRKLRRLSVGNVQTNPAGMRFFVATYAITQWRSGGTSVTSTYDVYFVLQGDAWRLWFTTSR